MWLIDLILGCWLFALVGFICYFAWEEGETQWTLNCGLWLVAGGSSRSVCFFVG